ncbi:MAG: PAS domain S-box protein, partial [Pseudomonadota bacterium]|nr:PAS domain S-box protein [Pseudomonadota bacterium]
MLSESQLAEAAHKAYQAHVNSPSYSHSSGHPERSGTDAAPPFLGGGGEAGALFRAYDWAAAPLGAPDGWPTALKTLVALVLGSNQAMYVVWGPERTLLYNDPYAAILAAKHPTAFGQDILEVWHEIHADLQPIVERAYRGESVQMDDIALTMERRGFPEETHFSFSFSPVRDTRGEVLGFLCACTEITAQVLTERHQAFQLDLAERLQGAAPRTTLAGVVALLGERLGISRVGYGELDPTGGVVTVAHEYTDGSVQAAVGAHRLDDFGPAIVAEMRAGRTLVIADVVDDPRTQAASAAHIAIGTRSIVAVPLVRDGQLRATLYLNHRHPRAWTGQEVALLEDVAARTWAVLERIRAEEALRDSDAQLRLATEAAEVGFWDVDPVNCVLVWPARVKAMFGISPDAPVSMADFYVGLHPEDREPVSAAFAAASDPAQRALYDVEYRTVGKEDGVVRWVAAKGRGVFDGVGNCVRVIGTAIDITARKQAEAALAASEAALRRVNETLEARVREEVEAREAAQARLAHAQRMEALGQLAGGIAHDFNNVVQAVQGGARLIEGRPDDRARVVRLARMVAEAAGRGAAITRRLLSFSRRADLRAEPVDVAALLTAMQEVLVHTLGTGVKVEVDAAPGLPPLLADKGQLETVLV